MQQGTTISLNGVKGGEGVTTVALLLALALGELNQNRVLYFDGNFKPQNFALCQDLFDLNENAVRCSDEFAHLEFYEAKTRDLFFLSTSVGMPDPLQLFSRPRIDAFLSELKKHFDFVIFDMPPLLETSETRMLLPQIDLSYVVCARGKTSRADLKKCLTLADTIAAKIDGAILNRQKLPLWARVFGKDSFI